MHFEVNRKNRHIYNIGFSEIKYDRIDMYVTSINISKHLGCCHLWVSLYHKSNNPITIVYIEFNMRSLSKYLGCLSILNTDACNSYSPIFSEAKRKLKDYSFKVHKWINELYGILIWGLLLKSGCLQGYHSIDIRTSLFNKRSKGFSWMNIASFNNITVNSSQC